jgi:hypothetical protein
MKERRARWPTIRARLVLAAIELAAVPVPAGAKAVTCR